jgi:hypothetical protein
MPHWGGLRRKDGCGPSLLAVRGLGLVGERPGIESTPLVGKGCNDVRNRTAKRNGPSNTPGTRIPPRFVGKQRSVRHSFVSVGPPRGLGGEKKKKVKKTPFRQC